MDITDWKAQEDIYEFADQCYGKPIAIVIVIAGILDSSNLVNDTEQGESFLGREYNNCLLFFLNLRWALSNIGGQSYCCCKSQQTCYTILSPRKVSRMHHQYFFSVWIGSSSIESFVRRIETRCNIP